MRLLVFICLLSTSALAQRETPQDPPKVPGDDSTSSSTGYHNTELNSAGPSTDFGSTIIRSQKEEAIDVQRRRRDLEKKKKGQK